MTRYTRAKGSKASNERLPNEATPWHLMKRQLAEEENKESIENKKSAKELLNNQENVLCTDTVEKSNSGWAEFESNKSNRSKSKKNDTHDADNSEKNNVTHNNASKSNNTEKLKRTENKTEEPKEKDSKSSNRKKNKSKHKTKNLNSQTSNKEMNTSKNNTSSNFTVLSKRQKRNLKRKLNKSNNSNDSKRFKKDVVDENSCKVKDKKEGEYKRRKPEIEDQTIEINGMEIKIVKYDGFPVKNEDAERLTELKKNLIMKGIPQSEVDITIKLERRKAEKALARAKKLLCLNCRKSGHFLSHCPELGGNEEAGTGICFKCGSTEHTHFECKVNRDSTYRYAKCFICREQGHIAAQCPDNPKGIYPNGGACKVCGAVTHLKKDCPDLVKAKEENTVTVEKMDDSAVEFLQKDESKQIEIDKKPKNKIIKF